MRARERETPGAPTLPGSEAKLIPVRGDQGCVPGGRALEAHAEAAFGGIRKMQPPGLGRRPIKVASILGEWE
jgi:hypothetical protein